jgi:hypothetical protein
MKTMKLTKGFIFATILVTVYALVGCEKLDHIQLMRHTDLQSRIDSIAAARANQSNR